MDSDQSRTEPAQAFVKTLDTEMGGIKMMKRDEWSFSSSMSSSIASIDKDVKQALLTRSFAEEITDNEQRR